MPNTATPKRPVSSPESSEENKSKAMRPDGSPDPDSMKTIVAQYRMILDSIDEMKAKLNDLELKLSQRIDKIESVQQEQRREIFRLGNEVARNRIERDVVISGVPIMENENTINIFERICTELGYTDKYPYVFVERSSDKNTQKNNSDKQTTNDVTTKAIFVEFATVRDKQLFLRRYFLKKNLDLTCLGFQNKARIYVNERLTKCDFQLKKKALKLKDDGKLHGVFTARARVFVRVTATSDGQMIDDEDELENFK
jgi:hypothetical protein